MSPTTMDQREFFRWAHGLVLAGDDRFSPLGNVDDTLANGIDLLAASVRRSVWHMTLLPSWLEVRGARPLAAVAARRDIDGRYVTDHQALSRLPLLSSHHAGCRVTSISAPLLLVDTRIAFVGAPRGHELGDQVWRSTSPAVVGAAVQCFETVWRAARPAVPHGESPPFTRRMVDVGFLLTQGASDQEIARELGVSLRTVSADVAEIVRRLGARNRTQAISLIGGAAL